jgi:hypothetical protein
VTGRLQVARIALDHLGIAQQHVGDHPAGLRSLTEALAPHRAAGHRQAEGRRLSHLGALEARRGRHYEAIEHLQDALAVAVEVGDEAGRQRDARDRAQQPQPRVTAAGPLRRRARRRDATEEAPGPQRQALRGRP